MKGAGYYDQHSAAQRSSIQALQDWIFNRLFANLDQARRDRLAPAGVYSSAVGGSFFDPLLPPGTVHLATCFNALHWLDRLPEVTLPDGIAYRRPHPPRPGLVSWVCCSGLARLRGRPQGPHARQG
jgi:hypothetical protein